jgi:hypothetical protein
MLIPIILYGALLVGFIVALLAILRMDASLKQISKSVEALAVMETERYRRETPPLQR